MFKVQTLLAVGCILAVTACGESAAFLDSALSQRKATDTANASSSKSKDDSTEIGNGRNSKVSDKVDTKMGKEDSGSKTATGPDDSHETLPPLKKPGQSPMGLIGGHFDLDTSHEVYPFREGRTDGHVHDYSDKYKVNGADFFQMLDPVLKSISQQITNPQQKFILIVANATLSPGAVIEINGRLMKATDFQNEVAAARAGKAPWKTYSLGASASEEVTQLKSFKVSFPDDAITKGGLIGTSTGCVRTNDPGAKSEYRNGALTIQALDASKKDNAIDPATGVATMESGSLLWEATLFWHWKGGCYGQKK